MITFPNKSHRLEFTIPQPSEELAEFCGIMLGDGGIAAYQATVTLHADEEREYGLFVANLIEHLFRVRPGLYSRKDSRAISLVLSRVGITDFLTTICGLKRGNKVAQKTDIPAWIKAKETYRIACMRGLFDTDSSVFPHRYTSRGNTYQYKKLSFTSASEPLLLSVWTILQDSGIKSRIGSRFDVRVDSAKDVARYFQVFGSNNPKHLKRYQSEVG